MSLQAERLSFSYGNHRVLSDLSFCAENGQLAVLLGPNGVGKTTLFRCILRLNTGYEGRILADGLDVKTLSPRETARRIAYIPQNHGQAFSYSVTDMVLMGTNHSVSVFSSPGRKERAAAAAALEQVGIAQFADHDFSKLSGGEQQMVLIARALAQGSRNLLMDEPTANLDYGNSALVMSRARALADDGYTVLLCTHNPQHALTYADRTLALLDGRVAAWGKPAEIMNPDLIRRLYGTDVRFLDTEDGPVISPVVDKKRNCEDAEQL
ncbi:MAG: ABC transporter ATP-binding protein [Lachnospiraceae bacterium]|nr:ABC transporter ATP-binding protein [Lachnospiraceae bacterium]